MKGTRDTKRQERKRNEIPSVAIAGYTNAGKSSLLNRLTGAGVLVEDSLFATLDPTTRRTTTADGRVYTMSDTVGFVRAPAPPARRGVPLDAGGGRRLRPGAARRRRLAPRPRGPDRRGARGVRRDRRRQGARDHRHQQGRRGRPDGDRPAAPARAALASWSRPRPARASTTCCAVVEAELPRPGVEFEALVPYARGDLIDRLHRDGEIDSMEHTGDGTRVSRPRHRGARRRAGVVRPSEPEFGSPRSASGDALVGTGELLGEPDRDDREPRSGRRRRR